MFRTGELVRDVGTVLIGPEAVRVGMIDEVGGLAQAVAKLEEMMGPLDPEERSHRRSSCFGTGGSWTPLMWTIVPDEVVWEGFEEDNRVCGTDWCQRGIDASGTH